MNAEPTTFDYDDFEQYLLDAAKIDQAPSDLPARLGVALGLGVPILVGSEMASVVPTTTSLSAGAGVAEVSAGTASKGLFAAVKSSLGIGSSALWGTAAKGIAVGVLSGAAVVGTGQAIVRFGDSGRSTHALAVDVGKQLNGSDATPSNRLGAQQTGALAELQNPLPPPPVESPEGESASITSPDRLHLAYEGGFAGPVGMVEAEPDKPVRRLPRPVFPEKTTAIARYPLIYDDVSALYDTPKKQLAAPAAPSASAPVDVGPQIDPTDLMVMRTKTIAQTRTLLGQGKAAQALLELNGFRKAVGDRYFGVDVLLLHIEALAALGRAKEAQADVAIVERLAPNSAALRQAQQLAASRFVR